MVKALCCCKREMTGVKLRSQWNSLLLKSTQLCLPAPPPLTNPCVCSSHLSRAHGPWVLCSVMETALESPNVSEENQYQYGSCASDQCSNHVSNDRNFSVINGRSMVHHYDRKPIVIKAQWTTLVEYVIQSQHYWSTENLNNSFLSYHLFLAHDHLYCTSHTWLPTMAVRGIIQYVHSCTWTFIVL